MYGAYPNYPYNMSGNIQQQLAQNRMEQLQQQYNNAYQPQMMQQQTQQMQMIKGRPVSSYDEAKASMIDLDGSLFVFTDIANKKIYTKQIMLDGSAELKTYSLVEQQQNVSQEQTQQIEYVSKNEFEQTINFLSEQIKKLKGGVNDVKSNADD